MKRDQLKLLRLEEEDEKLRNWKRINFDEVLIFFDFYFVKIWSVPAWTHSTA